MSSRVDCDEGSYCLNNGKCPQTADAGCDCPDGFSGSHCETNELGERCTLNCLHGGTCQRGKDPGMDLTEWPGQSTGGMHCACTPGYSGHLCEYLVDICGNYDHICLHGSKCIKNEGSYSCKCTDDSCRDRHRTQFCLPTTKTGTSGLDPPVEYYGGMAIPAFCFNGGECVDIYENGKWYSGCECHPLFEGPHCEQIKSNLEIVTLGIDYDDTRDEKELRRRQAITTSVVLFSALFLFSLLFVARQVRRTLKRRGENNTEINLQGFRDQIEEEEDSFTAFSPNGNMLFPAFGGGGPVRREEMMVLSDIDLT